jgi:hypothetical protein
MIGRFSFLQGDPARIDEGVAYVRDSVLPTIDALPGSHGLGMWVNRVTGEALVISVWEDAQSLAASEEVAGGARAEAAARVNGQVSVQRLEAVIVDQARGNEVGEPMRLLRLKSNPGQAAENTAWATEKVLPEIRDLPGYVSYVLAIDQATGEAAAMSSYATQADADSSLAATAWIRDACAERGIDITALTTYEVAIVGIR